jgi:hypothetical protein
MSKSFAVDAFVSTPYGNGTISEIRADDNIHVVRLERMTAYMRVTFFNV